jgi:hypothetical protein
LFNFRKRLEIEQINEINEKVLGLNSSKSENESNLPNNKTLTPAGESNPEKKITHKGKLITDATACPQDIAFTTDLNMLNDAHEMSVKMTNLLYDK